MINVKNEIQYILVTRTLEDMAQAGLLTAEELAIAKHLAVVAYFSTPAARPSSVAKAPSISSFGMLKSRSRTPLMRLGA